MHLLLRLLMQLIIHRGSHEIGGSCIELTTRNSRIILDAGLPLVTANRAAFDPMLIEGQPLEELIAKGTVPNVTGLFQKGPEVDALLLSHSHLDHAGLIHLTRPSIPIYASAGTSKMMLAGALFGRQLSLDRRRHREIVSQQTFVVGNFRVTPYAVDHSSFGSMAFLIEADGKKVLYSGDIRTHGRKPGMAKALLQAVGGQSIDALLMEGTHFGSEKTTGKTEHELEDEIVSLIESAPSIVLACFSPIDVDRVVTYYRAAKRTGRVFVVDVYTAFVMHLVSGEAAVPKPTTENGIQIFFNRSFLNKHNKKIERLFTGNRIELSTILQAPEQYLMVFRPSMIQLDFRSVLPARAMCLYSFWKGYLDRKDWVQLQDMLAIVEGRFVPAHASGHIYVEQLVRFVNAIAPKTVIPVHTFEPLLFHRHFPNARVLHDGELIEIT